MSKKWFFLIFLLTWCVTTLTVFANDFEKGMALYEQKRFSQAFPLVEKEARRGNGQAQFQLGKMYQRGEGTANDTEKAFYWYTRGAEQNNADAQNNLAGIYFRGSGVRQDFQKAFELYSQSAKQGMPLAQFNLGLMYRKGKGVQKNDQHAFEWFRKAAEQGNINAMHAVGIAYHFGEGVPIDRGEAAKWYEKAAEQNYLPSIQNLGALYMADGDGLSQDWDKTYYWSKKGLELGDKGVSALRLGIISFSGHGSHPVDNPQAAYYFNLAGENGRADAWYWLGTMQEYGFGVKPGMDKAMAYYQRSADEGFKPAEKRLEQKDPSWTVRLFWWARTLLGAD